MKVFTKICLILAAAAGGIGIVAVVIGMAMGADARDLSQMGIYVSPKQLNVSGIIAEVIDDAIETQLKDRLETDLEHQLREQFGEDFEERLEETIEDFIEERRSGYDGNGSNHHDGVTEHNYDPNHL